MAMLLQEKLEHLRAVEGQLRGLNRPLRKTELVRLMQAEVGEALSLPYLSQIERGGRRHLTVRSRELLARFFRVHPGYLVDDPLGFEEGLASQVETRPDDVGAWLAAKAEEQRSDPDVYEALLTLASLPDPRETLLAVARALASRESPARDNAEPALREVLQHG
jgi:transcriptional regulator with XRE-family HTH domain